MAEPKTKQNEYSVTKFLNAVTDEKKRTDCFALLEIMKQATKEEPKMWGTSIIGYGSYHYKYDSGHEGDSCLTGFSPRKQNITIYLMTSSKDSQELLQKLGKHKASKGACIYIKKLEDIDTNVLKRLIKMSVDYLKKKYR